MAYVRKSLAIPLWATAEEYALGVRQLRKWKNRRNKRVVCINSTTENRSRVERNGIIIESRW